MTGWAYRLGQDVHSGTIKLQTKGHLGIRFEALYRALEELRAVYPYNSVIVEEPFISPNRIRSSHAMGGYRGVCLMYCSMNDIEVELVSPSTLKKEGAGYGKASKEDMIAAASEFADREISDHNEADAVLLLSLK